MACTAKTMACMRMSAAPANKSTNPSYGRTRARSAGYSIARPRADRATVSRFFRGTSLIPRVAVKSLARSSHLRVSAEEATEEDPTQLTVPLPSGPDETVKQAQDAIVRAIADGITLIDVEFLLPLIGATDLDDWPGGVRQQFKAAQPMMEKILRGIPGIMDNGGCKTQMLDQADAIALWEAKAFAAVLFPTADTVDTMIDLSKKDVKRPLMFVNSQWTATGQIISDFGWGPWKKKREDFLAEFTTAYFLKQYRILGENVRMVHAYPGKWQVVAIAEDTQVQEKIAELDARPTYQEMETLLKAREGSPASMDAVTRLVSEFKFNADSLEQKPPQ